jgi:hypothetical protein
VHHVEVVLDREGVHPLQRLGEQVVVVVGEEEELAGGGPGSDVARASGPAGVGDPVHLHVAALGGERGEPVVGVVAGAVVDEDHLVLVGGQGLGVERLHETGQLGWRVVRRDHDADFHRHAQNRTWGASPWAAKVRGRPSRPR